MKIAFVDTGNTGRSLIAGALAESLIGKNHWNIAVISQGVDTDPYETKPEANAATLLLQDGINVADHRAAQLTDNDVRHSDFIITMTAHHKRIVLDDFPDASGKTFTISEFVNGQSVDVPDAYGKPMAVYQQVFAVIDGDMPAVLTKALHEKSPAQN